MRETKVRVGVVGVGRMGERHCRVLAGLFDVELAGVSDPAAERGRAVAARYDTAYYHDLDALLARVDAVTIAAPTPTHYALAMACLERGVHVLVEKPLAATVETAAGLVSAAEQTGAILAVGHIERFNPTFQELQEIAPDLRVVGFSSQRLSPFDTSLTDTDVVLDLMIHDLDLLLALTPGDVVSVQANGRSARTDSVDYAVASVELSCGVIASFTASRVTEHKVRQVEITALDAYVEADLMNKSINIYRHTVPEYLVGQQRSLRYRQSSLIERISVPTAEPLQLELQDFVRCVRRGEPPRVSGRDGLRALDLAVRIRERIYSRMKEPSNLPLREPTLAGSGATSF
jgi:predicted dehydrogenase